MRKTAYKSIILVQTTWWSTNQNSRYIFHKTLSNNYEEKKNHQTNSISASPPIRRARSRSISRATALAPTRKSATLINHPPGSGDDESELERRMSRPTLDCGFFFAAAPARAAAFALLRGARTTLSSVGSRPWFYGIRRGLFFAPRSGSLETREIISRGRVIAVARGAAWLRGIGELCRPERAREGTKTGGFIGPAVYGTVCFLLGFARERGWFRH